jgi:hypothetical protein
VGRDAGDIQLKILEGASRVLVVEALDIIESLFRSFLELRCFQTLGEEWIR